jgi:hypothetical protein
MANIQVVNLPADDSPDTVRLVNSIVNNSNTYCSGKIGQDYAKQLVDVNTYPIPADANERVIYIGLEGKTVRAQTARAFVIVTKYPDHWYIDLICSAPTAGVNTRKMALLRSLREHVNGRKMLSRIAGDANDEGMKYIELSALEGVITYYYSQGYRFIQHCGKGEPDWIADKMKELEAAQEAVLKNNYPDGEEQLENLEDEVKKIVTNRDFLKHVRGVYTEQDLRTSVGAEPENPADNGYTMILCLPTRGGSRRTRKKRTKRTRKSRKQKRTKRRNNTKRRRGRKSTIRRK